MTKANNQEVENCEASELQLTFKAYKRLSPRVSEPIFLNLCITQFAPLIEVLTSLLDLGL